MAEKSCDLMMTVHNSSFNFDKSFLQLAPLVAVYSSSESVWHQQLLTSFQQKRFE
jgi:hypothetical protein